jgi:hypothetical protein
MTNGARPGAPAQGKKGLPVLAWVAIGCGGLVVLGGVVLMLLGWFAAGKVKDLAGDFEDNPTKAAAEMIVRMNPELELVESDDQAGTLTIREKDSGKVVTVNYDEIQEGRISFESEEGKVEIGATEDGEGGMTITSTSEKGETRIGAGGDVPDWLPRHPATVASQSIMRTIGPSGDSGQASFTVDAPAQEVAEFYRSALEGDGYEITTTAHTSGEGSLTIVTGQREGGTVAASVTEQDGQTQAVIQYSKTP